jgi:hypothetical protein
MYKITAHYTDSTGTVLDTSTAEALGDAWGKTYATRAEAQDIADDLADDLPEGYETVEYAVDAA